MSATPHPKTIRLLMPQWQGGDYDLSVRTGELYPLGARILAFLAPKSDAPLVEVPVEPYTGAERPIQNGVVWQDVVLRQMRAARKSIEEHKPDRIITFGGDCLVNQAPFDYLNGRYKGNLGIVWIDAHPDISTPENHDREHAMILGNLLGGGDPALAKAVENPFSTRQVMVVGVEKYNSPSEEETVANMGFPVLTAQDVANDSEAVLRWIRENAFDNIAIHLDLDALDPKCFSSQFPGDPGAGPGDAAWGKLSFPQVTRLIKDISDAANVVSLGITEHMPWDARNLQHMMGQFPIMQ